VTNPIGGTGVAVTRLGFGAASIGNLYREVLDEQAAAAVDAAWQAGVRYFGPAGSSTSRWLPGRTRARCWIGRLSSLRRRSRAGTGPDEPYGRRRSPVGN
jgi:hypothetical protein